MSLALAPDDATGGIVSPDFAHLALLAEEVKAAQEHRRRSATMLQEAQERLRLATANAEAAEGRFREACPAAFGIAPREANTHPIEGWLAARCDLSDRTAATRSAYLFRDFIEWAVSTGLPQCEPSRWSPTRFGRELADRGYARSKDRSGNALRVSIRLRGEAEHV